MLKPANAENEVQRLSVLKKYDILDTLPEVLYDNITYLASQICGTPVALVSLVDEKRQWFKSRFGTDATETPRELSFCGHAILQNGIFEIPNAAEDPRFADSPLVTGAPNVIFYAGAPLKAPSGEQIGTLCVIDHKPRTLTESQRTSLEALASQVVALLELRTTAKTAIRALDRQHKSELQRLASASLLEKEREKLARVFEMTPQPIAILTGPEYIFSFTNSSYRNILFGGRELVGKTVAEVAPEALAQGFAALLDGVYKTGKAFHGTEIPIDLVQKDGSLKRFIIDFVYAAIRDLNGEVEGILVSATDVTEQVQLREKQIEARKLVETYAKELSIEKAKLEALISDSASAIGLMRGKDLVFEIANKKWRELVSPREYIGRSYADIYPELIGTPAHKSLQDIFVTGVPFFANEMKLLVTSPAGVLEDQYFDYANIRIHDAEGKPYGVYCNALNVTDKVRARLELEQAKQAAERANSTKSAFLANMSHEIRTPLGAIIGFTDLLREREVPEDEGKQYLETISRNGKALTRIIDDILDLAKVESGKLEIEFLEFSFFDLIDEVMDLFRERTRAKNIFLRANIDKSAPSRLISDPTRLRQILLNIVGNAVKFTETGGVTIDISGDASGDDSGRGKMSHECSIQITVKDTGVGIEADQATKLFQPFTQADNSTTRKFGGTGLGLALSRRLSNALGGDITMSHCQGHSGCEFKITIMAMLPTKTRVENAKPLAATVAESRGALSLAGVRILVADDSPDNQILVQHVLKKHGAQVETVNNGQEAFRKGIEQSYDLVLMDIQMPIMDGYEATRALRESGFKQPIIALTAHAMAEERARSMAAGCNGHITKPLDQMELLNIIHSQLKAARNNLRIHPENN